MAISHSATPVEFMWWTCILSSLILIYVYSVFRDLRNRPAAKISSLSQGKVQVSGFAKFNNNDYLLSPYTKTQCCFYYAVTRKKPMFTKDFCVDQQKTSAPFLLVSEDAECLVFPAQALLKGNNFKVIQFRRDNYIFTETLILPGAKLFIEGICAVNSTVDNNKKHIDLFRNAIDPTTTLVDDDNKRLIIRAPNKKQDGINFDYIISTISREDLIKGYLNYVKLLLILDIGIFVLLLFHYFK